MAPRLKLMWLVVALSAVAANLPRPESVSLAAGLDAKGEAAAKEASGLYRRGLYEDAAKLFAVVAAGAVTAVVLFVGKGGSNVPGSSLGNQGAFQ